MIADAGTAERKPVLILVLALVAVALLGYGPYLTLPFIGDDYVFIDQGQRLAFKDLLSRSNTHFGWYRPWSREIHFFALMKLFGTNEVAFRVAGCAIEWASSKHLRWKPSIVPRSSWVWGEPCSPQSTSTPFLSPSNSARVMWSLRWRRSPC